MISSITVQLIRYKIYWVAASLDMFLQDPIGVFVGAVIGHALCTGLAVIGGRMIAQRISVRTGNIL